MEKAVIKNIRSRYLIQFSDVLCAMIALIVGCGDYQWSAVIIFIFTAYSYMRCNREACITVFFIMLCALAQGVLQGYFYALGFTVLFILLHMVKILNQNLYRWMPWITALVVIPYGIREFGFTVEVLLYPIVTYGIMVQLATDYAWLKKSYTIARPLFGVLALMLGSLGALLMPEYRPVIMLITLLMVAGFGDQQTAFLIGIAIGIPLGSAYLPWLFIPMIVVLFRSQKLIALALLAGATALYARDTFAYVYMAIAMIVVLCGNERILPFISKNERSPTITSNALTTQNTIKRQMQNYASIFQSLSEYYSSINDVEASLLENMAQALQYQAEEIQKIDDLGRDHERLSRALEGYQYHVERMNIEESEHGGIHIQLEISNIKRAEIRMTLLPLLEVLLHRNLEVGELHSRRFAHGFAIQLCDHIPFEVQAYADSLKNSYTSSGDTFSIFRFRQSMICIISDGMGNGEKAARSSQLISSIFQRMMISGIPQESAIRCINRLVQSDTYATLDVICFNRSKGVAYISKSAACPTYLMRERKIYEITGNALPIGIISQIQPDCFEVELKANDEFLMVSDGISESEFYEWLKSRPCTSLREDVECFMDILKKQRRRDDSTMILTRVNDL